ncbi:DNA-methyltransferase [Candidatus Termititenax aidoneus]|uniref:DNA-methyltransferase n=1 Tax=Termititenax aidoneus TaxID=2218524 RepID=A0A388T7Z5_TERA1|nr:DNA-methyltransferase [Candidatus Termititenax aidoneus]
MRKLYSPLRYPGGKAKVLNFMKELITKNNFSEKPVYVEPYAGGAAVALGLLIEEVVSQIYINDFDLAIYSFWEFCIKNDHMRFIEKIRKVNVSIKEWHKQSKIYEFGKEGFDLGFATFFLNRCNHSGIIKGGVIGGLKQNSNYKIDCRFNKEDLISRVETISKYKDKIHIYREDTKNFLCQTDMQKILQNCLLYLDPPYYKKGKQLYKNFYTHKDHQEIADIMKSLNGKWVVSYDNRTEIQNLYNGFEKKEFNLTYCAGPIAKGAEVMFFSKELRFIPELPNVA